jgi:hypothetical protein
MLCNPKGHCSIHKSQSLVSTTSQMNPDHTPSISLKFVSILSYHLRISFFTVPFPSRFPANPYYTHLFSFLLHDLPTLCSWIDPSNNIRRGLTFTMFLVSFLPPPITASLFDPNTLLSTLLSNVLSLCPSLILEVKIHTHTQLQEKIIDFISLFVFLL